jgi:tetratricopeptide (TPR) repeat protein
MRFGQLRGGHGGPELYSASPGHHYWKPRGRGFHRAAPYFVAFLLLVLAGCSGGPLGQLQARLDLKAGNKSYIRGDFKDALRNYDEALRHAPRHALAALYRAYCNVNLFRMSVDPDERRQFADQAVQSFLKFLEVRDKNPKAPTRERIEQFILTLYLDADESDKALAFLEERLRRNPNDVSALQMLSNIKSDLGDVPGALELFRRRIQMAPENPDAHHALAVFAWSVAFNSRLSDSLATNTLIDEGLQNAQEAIQLKPDYFEAITYANLLYREKAKRTQDPLLRQQYENRADSLRDRAAALRPAAPAS